MVLYPEWSIEVAFRQQVLEMGGCDALSNNTLPQRVCAQGT
jgi:hypothetical protein